MNQLTIQPSNTRVGDLYSFHSFCVIYLLIEVPIRGVVAMFKSFWETELRTGFAVPSKHALRVVYILWRHKSTLSRSRTFVNLFGGFAQKVK